MPRFRAVHQRAIACSLCPPVLWSAQGKISSPMYHCAHLSFGLPRVRSVHRCTIVPHLLGSWPPHRQHVVGHAASAAHRLQPDPLVTSPLECEAAAAVRRRRLTEAGCRALLRCKTSRRFVYRPAPRDSRTDEGHVHHMASV